MAGASRVPNFPIRTKQEASQAEFESTLSKLSATFINLAPDCVNEEITNGLINLVKEMGADRTSLGLIEADSGDFLVTHSWARPGFPAVPKQYLRGTLPWLLEMLKKGEAIPVNTLECLPTEARCERSYLESLGVKSALIVPLLVEGKVIGGMSCSNTREYQLWDAVKISRVKFATDIFANALIRKRANEQLHRAYAEICDLKEQLERERSYLREEINLLHSHDMVVGNSTAIRGVLKMAEQVARTDSTVLVLGETGTGKELIARTIHEISGRNQRSMVTTNCAALPATLIESELFGREKGAYTGALAREIGRFELADQSTIFLDEVGELPPEVQSKLLRVLQEGEFERLGSSKTIKVNVRVIAATSRDLQTMVNEGKFRADLFYRLNVFPIVVPPLRERIEDIPALVWHILNELAQRMGRKVEGIQSDTIVALQRYSWPGNIRELRNIVERSLILNTGPKFRAEVPGLQPKPCGCNPRHLDEVEAEHLRNVLQTTGWRIRGTRGAAKLLGLKPTTLESRMEKLGISRPG